MDSKAGIPNFSEEEIRKVLGSSEGQALLRLLNRDGGAALQKAAQAVKNGNFSSAQEIMRPLMEAPDAAELVRKINRK